jgi:hypothetical protein
MTGKNMRRRSTIRFVRKKGDSHLLCAAPFGPLRQKVAVTFFPMHEYVKKIDNPVCEGD